MKNILLLLLFSFQFIYGQNSDLTSLEKKLASEKNTTKKLEIINDIVDIAFNTDMQQALVYAKKGVALSEESKDKNWLPKFQEMQGRMYANLLVLDSASIFFKKAEKGYIAVKDKKGQVKTYFKMAWVARKEGNIDFALQKDLDGLKLMETIDDKAGICDAVTRISDDLTIQNRLEEAFQYTKNELLLNEIHHRVKNNLEVVSGLLALQSSQNEDQSTKDAMQESQNRVNSIGIVHQKLYQGTNLGAIEMKDYVLNLSESILDSFGAEGKVKLELAMEKLDLDIDTAVPLGLIINELITNTVKYAFPNNGNGQLTIKLEKQANTILHLVVSDNDIGKSGITNGTGFGGQLILLLTQQLNGTMTEENQNGTTVIFDFKLRKAA